MIVPYTHLFPTNFVPLQPTEGNAEASRPPTSQRSHRVIYELLPITDWALSRDLQWGDEGESKRRPKDSVVLNNLLQLPDQNTKLPDERNKKKMFWNWPRVQRWVLQVPQKGHFGDAIKTHHTPKSVTWKKQSLWTLNLCKKSPFYTCQKKKRWHCFVGVIKALQQVL